MADPDSLFPMQSAASIARISPLGLRRTCAAVRPIRSQTSNHQGHAGRSVAVDFLRRGVSMAQRLQLGRVEFEFGHDLTPLRGSRL